MRRLRGSPSARICTGRGGFFRGDVIMTAATVTTRTGSEKAAKPGLETPQSPATRRLPRLNRETFRTSRLLEFCSRKELVAQTGHEVGDWSLTTLKEAIDNAIDACEEADIAPDIAIKVSTVTGEIAISDNGP